MPKIGPRPRDRGEQLHVGQRERLAVGGRAVAGGEPVEDGAGGEGDHLIAADLAGAGVVGARGEEGGEAHQGGDPTGRGTKYAHNWPRSDDDVPDGRGRDQGGGCRFGGLVPIVRRRDAVRAGPARAADARRRALPLAPRPCARASTGSSTRAAGPSSGCAPTSPRRWPTPTTWRWPRSARRDSATTSAPTRCTRALGAQRRDRRRFLPRRAARALRRRPRRRAGRARARRGRLQGRRRAALHDARARARLRARARVQRARPAAGSTTRCATTRAGWARSAASSACSPGATTAAAPSAAPPARWPGAPVAFLLEPSGREFVSTAMSGVDMAPVTIQPRPDTTGPRVHRARELLRARRAARTPRWRSRWSTRPRRAPRCSSRCCATARSPAC